MPEPPPPPEPPSNPDPAPIPEPGEGAPAHPLHRALSWLTVLPVPQPSGHPDRRDGTRVIATVPVVGVLLGITTAALAFGLQQTALPPLMIGALCVIFGALTTRGMHLDGLADTVDGLGCYGSPERTRTVMRSGDVGPFGASALTLTLLIQAVAYGALAEQNRWYAIVFAVFLGRIAVVIACRAALPPANADGFGALVAGTQRHSIALWLTVAVALAVSAGWLGSGGWTAASSLHLAEMIGALVVVVGVAVFAYAFTRHCARRMGGVSGDVLGGTLELSTTLALVVLLA